MDLREIARSVRKRQIGEALDFERDREAALRGQLEETAAELEGAGVDDETFAAMDPDDVAFVRDALLESEDVFEAEASGDDSEWLQEFMEEAPEDARQEQLEEIARLEEQIADSQRRQQALERYLEALAGSDA